MHVCLRVRVHVRGHCDFQHTENQLDVVANSEVGKVDRE